LDDAVRGQAHAGRQGVPGTGDFEGDRQAGLAYPGDQLVETVQGGLRVWLFRGGLLAEQAEDVLQFVEGFQRVAADGGEAPGEFVRRVGYSVGGGLGLDGHHRHVVGDHVVQLVGDPGAFFEQRTTGPLFVADPLLVGELP
jgi:hypothetical protein